MISVLKKNRSGMKCVIAVTLGIAVNLLCSIPNDLTSSPIYLDTIGTIVVACLCGYFPGILTGVSTNILKTTIYELSPYYAILSGFIAIICTSLYYKKVLKTVWGRIMLVFVLAFVGGVPGMFISYMLEGGITNPYTMNMMAAFQEKLGMGFWSSAVTANFVYDFFDKLISVFFAMLVVDVVPGETKKMLRNGGLKQDYVPAKVKEAAGSNDHHSLKIRTVGVFCVITIISVASLSWVSYRLYGKHAGEESIRDARSALEAVKGMVDKETLLDCVEKGPESSEYAKAFMAFDIIRSMSHNISHLYLVRAHEEGLEFILDLQADKDVPKYYCNLVGEDDPIRPQVEKMLRGEKLEEFEVNTYRGWNITVVEPVYLTDDGVLCYIGADIDQTSIREYKNEFLMRVLLITLSLLMVVLAFSMRFAMNRLILPLNSLTYCTDAFVFDNNLEHQNDEMSRIERLNITTGDEIEKLYKALKKMTKDSIAHEKNIRQQAQTISEMQSGLILVLADMVENRDCDTGNHTKRTAYYANIIMKGLKEKGYYTDVLTDNFISDVTQSAPLHDIGKIGISDVILNKPGKLTDEEFAIMKTHTTVGRDLLDRAISEVHGESYLSEARNLAAYHHEKWNGRGYPEGLAGEDIPLSARVMAIADVFDAVSQRRVYKEAYSFEQSVEIIKEESGISFDPKCVEAFLDNLDEVRMILESDGTEEFAV